MSLKSIPSPPSNERRSYRYTQRPVKASGATFDKTAISTIKSSSQIQGGNEVNSHSRREFREIEKNGAEMDTLEAVNPLNKHNPPMNFLGNMTSYESKRDLKRDSSMFIHMSIVEECFEVYQKSTDMATTSCQEQGSLKTSQAIEILSKYMAISDAVNICKRFDKYDTGLVTFAQVLNHFLPLEQQQNDVLPTEAVRLDLRRSKVNQNRSNSYMNLKVECYCFITSPFTALITGDSDGIITFWNPNKCESFHTMHHKNINDINRKAYRSKLTPLEQLRMKDALPYSGISYLCIILHA